MAEDISPQGVAHARAALDAHAKASGYVLDGDQHALTMLLADLLDFADAASPRLDFAAALAHAREIAAECRQ
jgi:hypothetical protein